MYVRTCMCHIIGFPLVDREREYRIAGIFRGYKCSWFSRIRHEPRTLKTANLILHACMLQIKKAHAIPRKLNPRKPF